MITVLMPEKKRSRSYLQIQAPNVLERHLDVQLSCTIWISFGMFLTEHADLRCRIELPPIYPNSIFHYSLSGKTQQKNSSPEKIWELISNRCDDYTVEKKYSFMTSNIFYIFYCYHTAPMGIGKYYMSGTCSQVIEPSILS